MWQSYSTAWDLIFDVNSTDWSANRDENQVFAAPIGTHKSHFRNFETKLCPFANTNFALFPIVLPLLLCPFLHLCTAVFPVERDEEDLPPLQETPVQDTQSVDSDDEEEEPPRTVLGESFITNRREQRISNHPSTMGRSGTRSDAKLAGKRKATGNDDDSDATLSKQEQQDLKIKNMEMEIARYKTREHLAKSKKKGRKSQGNSTDSATKNLVFDTTKYKFFSICKFLSDEKQLLQATRHVMNMLEIGAFRGLEGTKLAEAQELWVQAHKDTVREAINSHRNYIQHQLQSKFKEALGKGGYKLRDMPDPDEILEVALRKGLTDKDEFPARAQWVFEFYWDVLIPVVAGHKNWGPGKRHHCLMSTARPEGDPSAELFVTPSDEAYTVVCWENYLGPWSHKWKEANKPKKPKAKNSAAKGADPEDKEADPKAPEVDPKANDPKADEKAGGSQGDGDEGDPKPAYDPNTKPNSKKNSKETKASKKKTNGEDEDDEDEDDDSEKEDDDSEKEDEDPEDEDADLSPTPIYTNPNGGVQEFGGWNKRGRKRYREVLLMIKKSKGKPFQIDEKTKFKGSKTQVKHVDAVEKACLARVRAEHGIEEGKKRRKPNPAARPNEDLDSDHEPDWA